MSKSTMQKDNNSSYKCSSCGEINSWNKEKCKRCKMSNGKWKCVDCDSPNSKAARG